MSKPAMTTLTFPVTHNLREKLKKLAKKKGKSLKELLNDVLSKVK